MKKALLFARELVSSSLCEGGFAVDATCGNGHDTLFLAGLVGDSGHVLALDVQKEAIKNTEQKLAAANLLQRVTLAEDNHANLAHYLKGPVNAAMFNLGYLPGGDHNFITTPQTTLAALKAILPLLPGNGVITVVAYLGHDGGKQEYSLIQKYLSSLPQQEYTVLEYRFLNQQNFPPLLLAVGRL